MSLLDIISQAGGSSAIETLGARVGLSPEQTRSAAAALLPALAGGIRRQAGSAELGGALTRTGLEPGAVPTEDTVSMGNDLLGQIFGSKDVSRAVAARASDSTGIGADKLKALLPLLASLSAGALASRAGAGGGLSGLGGVLGMLDADRDGDALDDILGMAGKLFGR